MYLWELRQQLAEEVGLADHPTVQMVVTEQQRADVSVVEEGTPAESDC